MKKTLQKNKREVWIIKEEIDQLNSYASFGLLDYDIELYNVR